jgi:hypothetical protein
MAKRFSVGGLFRLLGVVVVVVGAVIAGRHLFRYVTEPPPTITASDEIEEFHAHRRAAFHTVERVLVGMLGGLGLVGVGVLVALALGKREITFTVRGKRHRPERQDRGTARRADGSTHRTYTLTGEGDLVDETGA